MKKDRYIIVMLVFALGLLSIPVSIYGAKSKKDKSKEVDAIYQIDRYTGEVYGEEAASENNIVYLNTTCYFDRENGMFHYLLKEGEKASIACSVANGMAVNGKVTVAIDPSIPVALYKDGSPLKKEEEEISFEDAGEYLIEYEGAGNLVSSHIRFTILGKYSSMEQFELPEGFEMINITCEDKPLGALPIADMKKDGKYVVEYQCSITGNHYQFTTHVDHTPPTLLLAAVDEEGKARGPVDLSDLEAGASLYVTRDNQEIQPGTVLTESGRYTVIVTDLAGNATEYKFTILVYLNSGSTIFLTILGAMLVIFVIYMIRYKKRFRVY